MNTALDKGLPSDQRVQAEWMKQRSKENNSLIAWLENFKSQFTSAAEATETINQCQTALSKYQKIVGPLRQAVEIQEAVNARKADGSALEYGLTHHLTRMTDVLQKGTTIPSLLPSSGLLEPSQVSDKPKLQTTKPPVSANQMKPSWISVH
jgi:hypothetical protein